MFLKSILTCVSMSTINASAKNFANQGGNRRKNTFLKLDGKMKRFSAYK